MWGHCCYSLGIGQLRAAQELHSGVLACLSSIRAGEFCAEHLWSINASCDREPRLHHIAVLCSDKVGRHSGLPCVTLGRISGSGAAACIHGDDLLWARFNHSHLLTRACKRAQRRGFLGRWAAYCDAESSSLLMGALRKDDTGGTSLLLRRCGNRDVAVPLQHDEVVTEVIPSRGSVLVVSQQQVEGGEPALGFRVVEMHADAPFADVLSCHSPWHHQGPGRLLGAIASEEGWTAHFLRTSRQSSELVSLDISLQSTKTRGAVCLRGFVPHPTAPLCLVDGSNYLLYGRSSSVELYAPSGRTSAQEWTRKASVSVIGETSTILPVGSRGTALVASEEGLLSVVSVSNDDSSSRGGMPLLRARSVMPSPVSSPLASCGIDICRGHLDGCQAPSRLPPFVAVAGYLNGDCVSFAVDGREGSSPLPRSIAPITVPPSSVRALHILRQCSDDGVTRWVVVACMDRSLTMCKVTVPCGNLHNPSATLNLAQYGCVTCICEPLQAPSEGALLLVGTSGGYVLGVMAWCTTAPRMEVVCCSMISNKELWGLDCHCHSSHVAASLVELAVCGEDALVRALYCDTRSRTIFSACEPMQGPTSVGAAITSVRYIHGGKYLWSIGDDRVSRFCRRRLLEGEGLFVPFAEDVGLVEALPRHATLTHSRASCSATNGGDEILVAGSLTGEICVSAISAETLLAWENVGGARTRSLQWTLHQAHSGSVEGLALLGGSNASSVVVASCGGDCCVHVEEVCIS